VFDPPFKWRIHHRGRKHRRDGCSGREVNNVSPIWNDFDEFNWQLPFATATEDVVRMFGGANYALSEFTGGPMLPTSTTLSE
jgi:hypothetical protein